ncbi:MAG: PQQ-binding-like beta-propeller repeat protein [Verrucomicrobia subdivision 3 bacterium]|nr:PQQ-binding-like beta-propeller repeat protein [Limisphaerales bacterium]
MRCLFLFIGLSVCAADWPTYRADTSRSSVTAEQLTMPLREAWVHQPLHAPRPAWRGPAKRDSYNKVENLKNRQLFDHAFHVVVDAKSVYFGSSVDDQVHCLDGATGIESWSFFTEGPVRFAPTIHGGKLFVGSDDGYAYCISTEGRSIWRQRLAPSEYRIAGNNRIISAWPVRTGILVRDDVAYAGAGMFPSEGVHVVAFSAADGKEQWRNKQTEKPAQGYLLVSEDRVYVPAGRDNPMVFDRTNGRHLRTVKGGGGTYALITGNTLIFGPGRKGHLGLVQSESDDVFANFSGNHMIISAEKSYLHADKELSVLDRVRYLKLEGERKQVDADRKTNGALLTELRKQKSPDVPAVLAKVTAGGRRLDEISAAMKACFLWRVSCLQPHALVLAGNTLFAGGDNEVAAYSTADGKQIWTAKVNGAALGLAVAHGRLLVSTDRGTIYCFTAQ